MKHKKKRIYLQAVQLTRISEFDCCLYYKSWPM